MKTKAKGFTLVELMIVVIIIGILAAFAYPAYLDSARKGKRSDGKAAILKVQMEQAKYRANNTSYATTLGALGLTGNSTDGYYSISIVGTPDATSYTVRANGVGDQANDDCEPLQLAVTTSGETFTPTGCW